MTHQAEQYEFPFVKPHTNERVIVKARGLTLTGSGRSPLTMRGPIGDAARDTFDRAQEDATEAEEHAYAAKWD